MNYVEWVEKVALAFAHMEKQHAQATLGALRAELGVDPPPGEDERYVEGAVWTAIEDLDAITVVNALSHLQILESENTRRVRAGAVMSTVWPSFFTAFLEPRVGFVQQLRRLRWVGEGAQRHPMSTCLVSTSRG